MPCFPLYPYRLTAFVTKCFSQAQEFIFIDDKNIEDALKWMAGNQLPSGCYANVGKLIHTAMKVRICPQSVREELVALTEQNPKSSGLGAGVTQVSALDRGDLVKMLNQPEPQRPCLYSEAMCETMVLQVWSQTNSISNI